MSETTTLFEKIAAREIPAEIVYEDELCIVFNDIEPQGPLHVLIVPKKVIPRIGEAKAEDRDLLGHLLLTAGVVARTLEVDDVENEGFRIVINHGCNGGEAVPHLHLHLIAGRQLGWPPG